HHHHVLTAFDRVLAGDELAAARRRRPRDVMDLVSVHELAEGFELATLALETHAAPADLQLSIAVCVELVLSRFVDVRIDADVVVERPPHGAPHEPEPTAHAPDDATESIGAALRREQRVRQGVALTRLE